MDEVTQQNSALVEENAATAKTLEHQAKAMDDQVDAFVIGEDHGTGAMSRPAAVAKRPAPAQFKAMPAKRPAAARKVVNGTAHKMQTELAAAVNSDWKEF